MPGLGTTYGRGGATSAPKDLLNADAILIMGSNMAENHPVGFQWVVEAREKGTQGYSCRSAVQPDFRAGGYLESDPRRVRHHIPRRPDSLRDRERAVFPRVHRPLYERAGHHIGRFKERKSSAVFSPVGTKTRKNTTPRAGYTRAPKRKKTGRPSLTLMSARKRAAAMSRRAATRRLN